jgi:hypothetical protein
MGLPDTHDVIWQIDCWLAAGAPKVVPNTVVAAIEEQGWKPEEILGEVLPRWIYWMGEQHQQMDSATWTRGYGWRVWYPSGEVVTSLEKPWRDLKDGLIGGVAYYGLHRRIVSGRDPFYLEGGLPRRCPSKGLPEARSRESLQPKEGVWVTDEQMAAFRKDVLFAFGLE